MTQQDVEQFVEARESVERDENMDYIFYFVGDYHMVPFFSIGTKDNEYDNVSKLDRDGVFRLNIGVSKVTYDALLADANTHNVDYTRLNAILPHPHYASQFYICILNPTGANDELVKKLIVEAHDLAYKKHQLRLKAKTA